jgi:hypothetical protein
VVEADGSARWLDERVPLREVHPRPGR